MDTTAVFRSKVDWWLILILLSIPGAPFAMLWKTSGAFPSAFWTPILVVTILGAIFFPIRYVFEGETVSVQCGIFRWEHTAFHVNEVRRVRPTHDVLASPALSLDRLSVDLGFRGEVLISPKDKSGFLRALTQLDSGLQLRGGEVIRSD
jgi:hypothetical protein